MNKVQISFAHLQNNQGSGNEREISDSLKTRFSPEKL